MELNRVFMKVASQMGLFGASAQPEESDTGIGTREQRVRKPPPRKQQVALLQSVANGVQ